MPFLIAFLVYGVLAVLVLAAVVVVGLARGQQPGRAVLAGVVGSLVGLLLGCAATALVCIALPDVGSHVGATALVVPGGVVGAMLGTAAGVAFARRMWSGWRPPEERRPDA